jgi:hypothetical protein
MVNAQGVRPLNGTVPVGTLVSTKRVASFVPAILMRDVFKNQKKNLNCRVSCQR